ncbi:MAG: family N-acetyltransferase [Massilia sp.]|nr:family N-acetyltransferase [Massilia sp.]MDB5791009.1 family N-acetyltransferase [Massilia sp.]
MSDEYQVAIEAEPDPDDMQALVQGLTEFNAAHLGGEVPEYLLATVREASGTLAGGLLGATYLGWLTIQVLWLNESARARGHGSALVAQAEAEALRRGCKRSFVETLDFQALPFYEKHGYVVHSRIDGFPPGGARYALIKELA